MSETLEQSRLAEQFNRCADLEKQVRELSKEAQRYRVLRDGQSWPAVFSAVWSVEPMRGEDLDIAVDAAISKESKP